MVCEMEDRQKYTEKTMLMWIDIWICCQLEVMVIHFLKLYHLLLNQCC